MGNTNMTPTPWMVYEDETITILGANELSNVCTLLFEGEEERQQARREADAIVSAVNETYGKGINPEVIGDLAAKSDEHLFQLYMTMKDAKAAKKAILFSLDPANEIVNRFNNIISEIDQHLKQYNFKAPKKP